MTTIPYKPREISKIDDAIFRELIFSKRSLAVFPKDPSKKIFFFEASSPAVIEKSISFALQVGQQKVDLSLELKPETPLVRRIEEVGGIESLPEEFRVALMTFAGREVMDALEHLFQLPVMVWDPAKEKEEEVEKKDLYFEILDSNASCEARARITLSVPLLERVLAVAKEAPMLKESALSGELLQGEVLIGSAILSPEDWKSLVPGDLIIIQEPSALATGQGRCLIKKSGVTPMVLKADQFQSLLLPLEKVPLLSPRDPSKGGDPSLEIEEKNGSLPTSIPITLELNFSAGSLSLTIEEALQLIKTKSIEKPPQVSRPLKIFIQERVVGAGDLVMIGGRYALVITQLY
ncbi:MAG: hypothetical protein K2W97_02165 [Chthoniobacterales bacterium]|nr:hypothetical protein [Chthoniobacterales bacterium]